MTRCPLCYQRMAPLHDVTCVATHQPPKLKGATARKPMRARNTAPYAGALNGRAKLTAAQVDEIRRLHGTVSLAELGRRFGVSKSAVHLAVTGRTWAA